MRWQEITEAPIDIHQMDYAGKAEGDPSSFRQDDHRILNSRKALDKIKHMWRSSVCDVILYFVDVGIPPEKAVDVALYGPGLSAMSMEQNRKYSDIAELRQLHIEPTPGKVTLIMTNNDGAQRHPATGWTIAHRMLHLFANRGDTPYQSSEMKAFSEKLDAQWVGVFSDLTYHYAERADSVGQYPRANAQYRIACAMGQSRACREKMLTAAHELLPEAFAQFMLRGKVTFNELPAEFDGLYLWDVERNGVDLAKTLKQVNDEVQMFAEFLTKIFSEMIEVAKGKVFSL